MRYTVFVKFNPCGKIAVKGNEITIFLRSRPEKGKANKELIYKVAKYFAISAGKVHIISGVTSSKKVIEIQETN
jgi:uncharacterized protein YggU (UPF0235/DUF167 family)